MSKLHLGKLRPFDTRNFVDRRYILNSFYRPFSGFLGGVHKGGYWVERLADEWSSTFRVKHSIPCNSATSGLMAACMAIGIGPRDIVWAPVYTMSATAACAKVLGADVRFVDIEPWYFSAELPFWDQKPKAIIVTNLFGSSARDLGQIRKWCDDNQVWMIEDNAQAPFAKFLGQYTGTIGHLGVFSLNVHKHMQTGEGGVVVTNDSDLALKVQDAVNHGELRGGITGLNLRMTEPIAALANAQLSRGPWVIEDRRQLALEMTDMVKDYPQLHPPKEMTDCRHVYYIWACKLWVWDRALFVKRLNNFGLPMREGYSPLLSEVFKSGGHYPIANTMEHHELMTFDICSYAPTKRQRKAMREIFKVVADNFQ